MNSEVVQKCSSDFQKIIRLYRTFEKLTIRAKGHQATAANLYSTIFPCYIRSFIYPIAIFADESINIDKSIRTISLGERIRMTRL